MARAFKAVAVSVARVADERKGEHIQLLDVRKTSNVVDYLVVVTALSRPHIEALEQKIVEALEENGLGVHHRSRPQTDAWRVLVEQNSLCKHRIEKALANAGFMTPIGLLRVDLTATA